MSKRKTYEIGVFGETLGIIIGSALCFQKIRRTVINYKGQ